MNEAKPNKRIKNDATPLSFKMNYKPNKEGDMDFIKEYGKTTTSDCNECEHYGDGFEVTKDGFVKCPECRHHSMII